MGSRLRHPVEFLHIVHRVSIVSKYYSGSRLLAYSGQGLIRFDALSGQNFCSSVNAVGLVSIHGNCTPRLIRSKGQNKHDRLKRGPL